MLVSIIIPVYNRASVVSKAINSVKRQTFTNWELIIVDDGSTDNLEKVIKKINIRNLRFLKQKNKGQGAARNLGDKYARGEWLAFLDSDDEWMRDKLEKQAKVINRDPYLGLISTNGNIYKNELLKGNFFEKFTTLPKSSKEALPGLIQTNFILNSSVIIRRCLFEELGGFDERELMREVEDYDLWLKVAKQERVEWIEEPLINYYYPPNSKTDIKLIIPKLRDIYSRIKQEVPNEYLPLVTKRLNYLKEMDET